MLKLNFCLAPVKMAVIKKTVLLGKGPSYSAGNVKLCTYHGRKYKNPFKKLKNDLPYDTVVPSLNKLSRESKKTCDRITCPFMLTMPIYSIQDTGTFMLTVSIHSIQDMDTLC